MKSFTYEKYIECIHKLRLNAIFQIAEEGEKYNIQKDEKIKNILENGEEAVNIINNFLKSKEKIKKEQLLRWESTYIVNKYKEKGPIAIYKKKSTQTFYLIDRAEEINNVVKYRILNYCIDIIYDWTRQHKTSTINRHPNVVPIILYTGKSEILNQKENFRLNQNKKLYSITNHEKYFSSENNPKQASNQIKNQEVNQEKMLGQIKNQELNQEKMLSQIENQESNQVNILDSNKNQDLTLDQKEKFISNNIIENYKIDIQLNVIELNKILKKP